MPRGVAKEFMLDSVPRGGGALESPGASNPVKSRRGPDFAGEVGVQIADARMLPL